MFSVYFDSTATRSYTALVLRRFVAGPLTVVIGVLLILPFALEELETNNMQPLLVAVGLLAFTIIILRAFIHEKLENDNQPPLSQRNTACLLSVSVLRRLNQNPQNEYELLEGATLSRRGKFILEEMGVTRERFLELAKPVTENRSILSFLEELLPLRDQFEEQKIHAGIILYGVFQRKEVFGDLLNALDLSLKDLEMIVKWEQFHHLVWHKEHWWKPGAIVRSLGGVGRTWVMGYNDALDRLTQDLSSTVMYRFKRQVVLHQRELQDALHVLDRSAKHNLIIVGKEGVGKRSFIEAIAHTIRTQDIAQGRAYTRVLLLNAEELLSGTGDPDGFFLSAIKRADKTGRYVLVIRNIGLFLQAGNPALRGVLGRVLDARNIDVIGIADTRDYHSIIKTDAALDAQFEKITLEDPERQETMAVLMEAYFGLADREHVQVTYKALKSIVDLAERYMTKNAFPGKAIDVLTDAVMTARREGERLVTEDHIRAIVSTRSHVNVEKVDDGEKDILLGLAEQLHKRIVGQTHAIDAITNALKRARLQIKDHERPIGTFLFLGPTGVGKTETAKALAELYFGSKDAMIRLDMNEYSTEDSVTGIVGSSDPRKMAEGFLSTQVQDKPYTLILLDEIEKAHPHVINVFLQILDEGHLIDALGTKIDFRNTIIIATSNAGSLFIREFIKTHPTFENDAFKKSLLNTLIEQKMYSPEFLNRFDDVVLYLPLTQEQTVTVARMMIQGVTGELSRKQGITVVLDEAAIRYIAERGYSPEFGAREMRRAVTDILENHIADRMLREPIKRGDTLRIEGREFAR